MYWLLVRWTVTSPFIYIDNHPNPKPPLTTTDTATLIILSASSMEMYRSPGTELLTAVFLVLRTRQASRKSVLNALRSET